MTIPQAQYGASSSVPASAIQSTLLAAPFSQSGPWDLNITSMVRTCLAATHADSSNQRIFRWINKIRSFAAEHDRLSGTAHSILPMSTDSKVLKTVEALVYKGGRDGKVVSQTEVDAFVNAVDQIHLGDNWP